jgi:hypothetical protein
MPVSLTSGVPSATIQKLEGNVEFALYNNAALIGIWAFSVKPEEISQAEITRNNLQQGQISAYVNLYGPGLIQITLQGISPLKLVNVKPNFAVADGYDYFKWFIDNIFRTYQTNSFYFPQNWTLHFYNWVYNEFFEVVPMGLDWNMNVPRQTVFQYELQLVALRRLAQPTGLPQNDVYQTLLNYPTQALQQEINNATQFESEIVGILNGNTKTLGAYAQASWMTSDIQNVPAQLLVPANLPTNWAQQMTDLLSQQVDPYLSNFRPSFGIPAPASGSQLRALAQKIKSLRQTLDATPGVQPYLLLGRTSLLEQSLINMQAFTFLMEA